MSLAIDVDRVLSVLIGGEWFDVLEGSFSIDAYEYIWHSSQDSGRDPMVVHGGGAGGITSSGYQFKVNPRGVWMAGPLDAVQAVRYKP